MKPTEFQTDYEVAAMNAIKCTFPAAEISGCFYHFSNAVWRKAKSLHLTDIKDNRIYIRRLIALAHLPVDHMPEGYLAVISSYEDVNDNMEIFNNYFCNQWLNPKIIETVSCYNKRHRTTNKLEGWHSRINKIFGKRPNLFQFISLLKNEASQQAFNLQQANLHSEPSRKRSRRNINIDVRIREIVDDFVRGQIEALACVKRLCLLKSWS